MQCAEPKLLSVCLFWWVSYFVLVDSGQTAEPMKTFKSKDYGFAVQYPATLTRSFSVFVAVNERGHAGEALRVGHDRQLYQEFLAPAPTLDHRRGSQRALSLADRGDGTVGSSLQLNDDLLSPTAASALGWLVRQNYRPWPLSDRHLQPGLH
jgi:hypothetical protein